MGNSTLYYGGLAPTAKDAKARTHPFTIVREKNVMTAATQFDQVSVIKRANVYFEGKCVSHTVLLRRRHPQDARREAAVC